MDEILVLSEEVGVFSLVMVTAALVAINNAKARAVDFFTANFFNVSTSCVQVVFLYLTVIIIKHGFEWDMKIH